VETVESCNKEKRVGKSNGAPYSFQRVCAFYLGRYLFKQLVMPRESTVFSDAPVSSFTVRTCVLIKIVLQNLLQLLSMYV
jgi:hypothetical protein